MIVITSKPQNDIAEIGETYELETTGDPYIPELNVAYSLSAFDYYEVESVPEDVEPSKWCYTPQDGFYKNKEYAEPNPYGLDPDLVERIKNDAITEVEEAVINADE